MDTNIDYQLFSELNIEVSESSIDFFKTFLMDRSNKWIWPTSNLPYIFLPTSNLLQFDFGEVLNNFIKEHDVNVSILKIPPHSHVPWHIDVQPGRRCVLNVPFMQYLQSYTFVTDAPSVNNLTPEYLDYNTFKIPYNQKKLYLLNSQRYHSVFNCSNHFRYVISFCTEFLDYFKSVQYFKKINLVNKCW